ncbi:MAG TPA: hypothetical protein DCK98_06095 [Chloroflexi bacterium]|nr:hypothetical protein [Chloroflexota bacterium]HAL27040.1 hypothetical protein [Chloroflexota bacterium]
MSQRRAELFEGTSAGVPARYCAVVASGNAPKRPGRRGPTRPSRPASSAELERPSDLEATRQELREALEQQAATSEVLKVISRSAADLQPVFDAVVQNANRLCAGDYAFVYIEVENGFRNVAASGGSPELVEINRRELRHRGRDSLVGRVAVEERVVQIPDVLEDPEYTLHAVQRAGGFRTLLGVPMKRGDGALVGVIGIARDEVRPFTPREIELVEIFADQGAIAIENVRLFNETKEALERQMATSEVLRAIDAARDDVRPVLQTIVEAAIRLCGADHAGFFRRVGADVRMEVSVGEWHGAPIGQLVPAAGFMALAFSERRTQHVPDVLDPSVAKRFPGFRASGLKWSRSRLVVPVLTAGEAIGVMRIGRAGAGGFTPREIELVESFAAQAAIAIENVRLFNETREALERQTALAEILRVIARSPTDVQPVLDAIAESAARFCAAEDVSVGLMEGEMWRIRAHHGPVEITPDVMTSQIGPTFVSGRSMIERRTIHVPDLRAEADQYPRTAAGSPTTRAIVATPLLSAAGPIGALFLRRTEATPFTDRQIELAETFAAQAVIAIENVRLFNDTREALERQTALGEILRVIAASPSDITPVLDAIAESAARFCVAENVSVIIKGEDGLLHVRAHVGPLSTNVPPWVVDRTTVTGRSIVDARTIQIPDLQTAGDEYPLGRAQALVLDERATMAAPLIRDGRGIGALLLRRAEVRPFSDKQVELVKVFADQAVIAIENVRLISEIQAKSAQLEGANHELAAASRHKSEFLANMSHELRTPLNAIIGFSDVLEQRLFGELNERQADYTRDIASSGRHLLDLVNEILDLSKVEAGRMELEPSEFALAETIRGALAFVRERAVGHRIALGADIPPDLGTVVADERKVRQVLLNLLSNAVKFTPDGGTIDVRAWRTPAEVQVSVRDTGIGIAPADQAKVFDEFQQVGKPSDRSREGTGLGLTLAKRFIELHGGRIWIESEVGTGTTFTFAIPVDRAGAAPDTNPSNSR